MLVFVGASPALSDELDAIRRSFQGLLVVAPAAKKKHQQGPSPVSVQVGLDNLVAVLTSQSSHTPIAKLTVWTYQPIDREHFKSLWDAFGKSAWVELVPADLRHKVRPTRRHIENRLRFVDQALHEISDQIYRRRKVTPLSLPLANFKSGISLDLSEYWYGNATLERLRQLIEKKRNTFRQMHTKSERAHHDDRSLIFAPAQDGACHRLPHPAGAGAKCFVNGRFRFGAALFPGFHYDVRAASGTLNCTLVDCDGNSREMGPERRDYINIFPNDHLHPKRS
jgi:hypothetical protein